MLSTALKPKFHPIAKAEGYRFWLSDGKEVVDLAGQTLNLALGQGNETVLAAVRAQLDRVHFASSRFATPAFLELSQRLVDLAPPEIAVATLKLTNGSDAVETAAKIARMYTRRSTIGCLANAWHGESFFTLSLSSSHLARLVTNDREILVAPGESISALTELVVASGTLAGVIVDPACVSSGLTFGDVGEELQSLRRACDDTGTLLIFDEIQTFGGYLGGSLYASEAFGVTPDIICLGKALGAGFPLAGVLCSEQLRSVLQYNDAEYTYGGHPVSCAAASAALDVYESLRPTLADRVRDLQAWLPLEFDRQKFEVRQAGLMFSIGLKYRGVAAIWVTKVIELAMQAGLFVRSTDNGHRILIKPPIIMDTTAVMEHMATLARFCDTVLSGILSDAGRIPAAGVQGVVERSEPAPDISSYLQRAIGRFSPTIEWTSRGMRERQHLSESLTRAGIPAQQLFVAPTAEGDVLFRSVSTGRRLSDVLVDPAVSSHEAEAMLLRHYEIVALAHDRGLSIGPRTAANALVDGSSVLLAGFEHMLIGTFSEQCLFEEAIAIIQTVGLLQDVGRRQFWKTRLLESFAERYGSARAGVAITRLRQVGEMPSAPGAPEEHLCQVRFDA